MTPTYATPHIVLDVFVLLITAGQFVHSIQLLIRSVPLRSAVILLLVGSSLWIARSAITLAQDMSGGSTIWHKFPLELESDQLLATTFARSVLTPLGYSIILAAAFCIIRHTQMGGASERRARRVEIWGFVVLTLLAAMNIAAVVFKFVREVKRRHNTLPSGVDFSETILALVVGLPGVALEITLLVLLGLGGSRHTLYPALKLIIFGVLPCVVAQLIISFSDAAITQFARLVAAGEAYSYVIFILSNAADVILLSVLLHIVRVWQIQYEPVGGSGHDGEDFVAPPAAERKYYLGSRWSEQP